MADFKKKAVIPKKRIPVTNKGDLPTKSAGIETIGMGPFTDLVAIEELTNQNTTWADPDPFEQLKQKYTKKIGAANPYILAPLLLNRTIDWNDGNAQATLMEAFHIKEKENFADIFNPGSVLFSQAMMSALLKGGRFPVSGGTGYGAQTGSGAPATPGRIAKTYDPITPSANHPPPTVKAGTQPPATLPIKNNPNGTIKDVVDDSMQGACLNCYFIAALYSRAWCSYPSFPPALPSCPGGYNITFYTSACGSVTKCVTPTFPVDDYKQPVFAQMTTDWELWSSLYEKAYAMFLNLYPPPDLPNHTATDPNISAFPPGDPLLSLFHITKMKWDFTNNNTIAQPSAFLTSNLSGFASSYAALNKDLSAVVSGSRKTLYPTVAWTYDTKPSCSSVLFGSNNPYGNDLIVPSHSYSILGSVTINAKNYIVLRNPWGANYVGDPSGSIIPYLATGQFTASGISFDLGRKPNGTTTDGIFALRSDAFDCLFQGFGWVQFRCA